MRSSLASRDATAPGVVTGQCQRAGLQRQPLPPVSSLRLALPCRRARSGKYYAVRAGVAGQRLACGVSDANHFPRFFFSILTFCHTVPMGNVRGNGTLRAGASPMARTTPSVLTRCGSRKKRREHRGQPQPQILTAFVATCLSPKKYNFHVNLIAMHIYAWVAWIVLASELRPSSWAGCESAVQ